MLRIRMMDELALQPFRTVITEVRWASGMKTNACKVRTYIYIHTWKIRLLKRGPHNKTLPRQYLYSPNEFKCIQRENVQRVGIRKGICKKK